MTMNCLAKSTQRTGEPEAPAQASVPERFRRLKWNEVVSERFRPASTRKPKQNAKQRDENTKNHCVLETNLRLERGRTRHFGKITICPTKIAIIISNPLNYTEMLEKSGQSLSPCVEVNGHMLADVNGDEVEAYLLEAGVLHLTAGVANAPANWACDAHHHE